MGMVTENRDDDSSRNKLNGTGAGNGILRALLECRLTLNEMKFIVCLFVLVPLYRLGDT